MRVYLQAYGAAIARVVQKKKVSAGSAHVLDLGTGCGVLAVMAARAGADSVVACDIHDSLCGVARQVRSTGQNKTRQDKEQTTPLDVIQEKLLALPFGLGQYGDVGISPGLSC